MIVMGIVNIKITSDKTIGDKEKKISRECILAPIYQQYTFLFKMGVKCFKVIWSGVW